MKSVSSKAHKMAGETVQPMVELKVVVKACLMVLMTALYLAAKKVGHSVDSMVKS